MGTYGLMKTNRLERRALGRDFQDTLPSLLLHHTPRAIGFLSLIHTLITNQISQDYME